eukprot:CAMPEP_0197443842 /NCGR_PEP_ID=MMETSP1175-20131217/9481_1 /TAXON_ID=1003142 /ORGANISM="Triceratium dubium, Strain CCMP147" /LENGTH=775 /DNA_ID=CAMNT_0042974533 /DNA_START=336 /DNA_END=2663 /DNA_ORIENTATION=+
MSGKHPGGALAGLMSKKAKSDQKSAVGREQERKQQNQQQKNPYLNKPVNPEEALKIFLVQARKDARRTIPGGAKLPITEPFVEIEARIGILKAPFGLHDMRIASSGPKRVLINGKQGVANAFVVSMGDSATGGAQRPHFEGGITRSHYTQWTMAGLSEASPVSSAFGVRSGGGGSESERIRRELVETEMVETVYGGYAGDNRVCFPGDHHQGKSPGVRGKMEHKAKLTTMDVALPAAPYDLRLTLATERAVDKDVSDPPPGWRTKRLKRRRSYTRRDRSFAWQLDVTEVTSMESDVVTADSGVSYEIEMELNAATTLKLVNENNEEAAHKLCKQLSQQLWYALGQINPIHDVLDVEEHLREHPDQTAVRLALAQCGALKRFVDSRGSEWRSAISPDGNSPSPPASLYNIKFMGCMPVNFQRHNIEEVQRSEDNGYFLSEKTDGVRYLMVFTGSTAVLVDRAMKGNQPKPVPGSGDNDPLSHVLSLIRPGTVLDGEVVMHRKLRRPIFIVFDVLAISTDKPVLHLPFEQRLKHLKQATFRTATAQRDMFAPGAVKDTRVALPFVRKNFVKRTEVDSLLSNVSEERGLRSYKSGETHYHLTDGIIFQPNLPYVCGTDVNLLKWKYLDTVTIDVEILPPKPSFGHSNDDEDVLRVGVIGDEGTMVDMTRFIKLPPSERRRLEADRNENGAKIVEVGFEPTTGEWYYLTTRPDKVASNHISTVIGTLLELAESLSTEELRYRMSVPPGSRDTYRKDMRGMQKQLLEHQRQKNRAGHASR